MSTTTELEVVDHVINPGRKIQCHDFIVRNYYLQRVIRPASALILGLFESDSNNSFAQNSARETRMVWTGWNVVKKEWELAKKNRDNPSGRIEAEHHILIPTPNEFAALPNMKIAGVTDALKQFCSIVYNLDSSSMQTWVGSADIEDVEIVMAEVEECMLTYLGTGNGSASAGFDCGMAVPLYKYGVLKPDLDLDSRHEYEPSTEKPRQPYPDSPDLPSTAPKPNSNLNNPPR